MSIFSKLFGGGGGGDTPKASVTPETYQDYRIFVEPMSDQGGYRIAATIEKDFGEDTKSHRMVRADTCQSMDEAQRITLVKAKMLIDQEGDDIF